MSEEALKNFIGDESRDLGFGAIVARESQQRLLNRDGSFNVRREGLGFLSSINLYQALLTASWTKFFSLVALGYLSTNLLFAAAYLMCGSEALTGPSVGPYDKGFLRAFFFSVQTLSTIGYGHVHPITLPANILVTFEALVGLLGFAIATGMLFARFSKPTAKIIFSEKAVVAPYRGITAFEFRISNARKNQIIELEAIVIFAKFEQSGDRNIRRFYPLNLERSKVAFFPLTWTIVHPIDESSPLYRLTERDLLETDAEFLILLKGIDDTFSQTVHTRSSYKADEVVWNAKFGNIFRPTEKGEALSVDLRKLHSIEVL